MKKIIFNGIHSKVSLDLIKELLKTNPQINELVTICSFTQSLNASQIPETKYTELDYWKIIYGKYDLNSQSCLGKDILDQLGNEWFVILKMFDRMSPFEVSSYESRMELLLKHISYWNDLIEKKSIDCFISINYPHEIYDYVIYTLCKAKKIKVLFFAHTQIKEYVQLLESIEQNDPRLDFKIPESQNGLEKLPDLIQKHWDMQKVDYNEPFYMVKNREELKAQLSNLNETTPKKRIAIFSKIKKLFGLILKFNKVNSKEIIKGLYFRSITGADEEKKLIEKYESISISPDIQKKYVYVPLHYQPECTTSPQGGYFVYQELIIEMLSKTMPKDIYIYVKEHPMQRLHGRKIEFYEKLGRLPNVIFVKKGIDSQILLKNCWAVATVSGTAGWEGLFKNKPVLLFGYGFYQYAPGVFRIRNQKDCEEAISSISVLNKNNFEEKLHFYLFKLEPFLIRGWVYDVYENVSKIPYEENIRNLVNGINSKFKVFSAQLDD